MKSDPKVDTVGVLGHLKQSYVQITKTTSVSGKRTHEVYAFSGSCDAMNACYADAGQALIWHHNVNQGGKVTLFTEDVIKDNIVTYYVYEVRD